jgi:hypothetical protein
VKGPHDERIPTRAGEEAPVESATKPPGGKALLRLLELLERRGYDTLAGETIRAAVSEERMEQFSAVSSRYREAGEAEPAEAQPGSSAEDVTREQLSMGLDCSGAPLDRRPFPTAKRTIRQSA